MATESRVWVTGYCSTRTVGSHSWWPHNCHAGSTDASGTASSLCVPLHCLPDGKVVIVAGERFAGVKPDLEVT